jgi:cytoskeletal protein RodZ
MDFCTPLLTAYAWYNKHYRGKINRMPSKRQRLSSKSLKQRNLVILVVLLIMVGGGLLLWNSTRTASKTNAPSASTKSTTGGSKQYSSTQATPSTPSSTSTSTSSTTAASTSLAAPSGQLLNVQTVSLSSGPGLESVCQTIANASCDIRLTQNDTTKYVGAQSTGSNGMVIFDWNAKSVGLTSGQWNVQAVVTQNGATGVSHTEYLTVQS